VDCEFINLMTWLWHFNRRNGRIVYSSAGLLSLACHISDSNDSLDNLQLIIAWHSW